MNHIRRFNESSNGGYIPNRILEEINKGNSVGIDLGDDQPHIFSPQEKDDLNEFFKDYIQETESTQVVADKDGITVIFNVRGNGPYSWPM